MTSGGSSVTADCLEVTWQLAGDTIFFLPISDLKHLLSASQGHHREVWCLAISPNGDHLVSSSHDKSLRLWERTREPIILEEEREMVRRRSGWTHMIWRTRFFVSLKRTMFLYGQEREAEFEESLAQGDAPVVSAQFSTSRHPQHVLIFEWYSFTLAYFKRDFGGGACLNQKLLH